jgi:hypothetical protein
MAEAKMMKRFFARATKVDVNRGRKGKRAKIARRLSHEKKMGFFLTKKNTCL